MIEGIVAMATTYTPAERTTLRTGPLVLIGLVGALLLVPYALGAASSGHLLGLVRDASGQALSDIRMLLTDGLGQPRAVTSDENGRFRLDDLPPGNYVLKIEEEGFHPVVYEPVHVRIGRATTLRIQLAASVDETVVVTSEPPTVAVETSPSGARVASELERIPVASDPFAATRGLAGSTVDESDDSQTPGKTRHDPLGPSTEEPRSSVAASFFDPASGVDGAASAPGASVWQGRGIGELDLLTHRGDRFRLELFAAGANPAASVPEGGGANDAEPGGHHFADVSQLVASTELGAQASGLLIPELLFAWGSHRRQEARHRSVGGLDQTLDLTSDAVELSAPLPSTSLQLGYWRSELRRTGVGAGPDRSRESTLESDRPGEAWRLQGHQLFGRGFEVMARAGQWTSGHFRAPAAWREQIGGAEPLFLDPRGVWVGTFGDFSYLGEHEYWQIEAIRARGGDSLRHELRFGAAGRRSEASSEERWGSDGAVHLSGESLGLPFDLVRLVRPLARRVERDSSAFWIGETLRRGRFTLDMALRHDLQRGSYAAGSIAPHPLLPELLPGFEHPGGDAGFDWNTTLPRLSAAWALDRDGRTVLRSGYGIHASRLDDDLVGRVSPATPAELVLTYTDGDADRLFDAGEPFLLLNSQGVDPAGSRVPRSAHRNPLSLAAEETEEWTLALEHAPDTAWTLALDFRQHNTPDALELRPLVRQSDGLVRTAQSSDYVLDQILTGRLGDGSPYLAPVYALDPALEATGGHLLVNGDRRRSSRQLSLTAQRRLVDGWQLRARFVARDREWQLGEEFARFDDPTDLALSSSPDAGISLADGSGDPAGPVLEGRVEDSRWAFELFAAARIAPRRPWGFDASAVVRGREGFSIPYQATVLGSDGRVRNVQLTPRSDHHRLDDVVVADLRLEKDWSLPLGESLLVFSLDIFNLFDRRTVLDRESRLTGAQADQVHSTLHPRTFRIGARWSW